MLNIKFTRRETAHFKIVSGVKNANHVLECDVCGDQFDTRETCRKKPRRRRTIKLHWKVQHIKCAKEKV